MDMKLRDIPTDRLARMINQAEWDCVLDIADPSQMVDHTKFPREKIIKILQKDGLGEDTPLKETFIGFFSDPFSGLFDRSCYGE